MEIEKSDKKNFELLCRDILKGLGMSKAVVFPAKGIEQSYRLELTRISSDRMFQTKEAWYCAFIRLNTRMNKNHVVSLVQAAISAHARYFLAVIFGPAQTEAETIVRTRLAKENTDTLWVSGRFALVLAKDYGSHSKLKTLDPKTHFSFSRLRKYMKTLVKTATWRPYFQTSSIQPARVLPLHFKDKALTEADLFRALHNGSFLLLGDPGIGKTTSLLKLGEDLVASGGFTPVFLPLGRYRGDFWQILCEALSLQGKPVKNKAPSLLKTTSKQEAPFLQEKPVDKQTAQALVKSGALVLLLDGINEVQDPDLHEQLVNDLNSFTAPDSPFAVSRWIVSGRIHDYEQERFRLTYLEARRWEMQPFTADLVYRFLADALGDVNAKALYHILGESVREICTNPLLLTMLLNVYQKTGNVPLGRGSLYRMFIDLLFQWGDDRGLGKKTGKELERLLPEKLTDKELKTKARNILIELASSMPATSIKWNDARKECEKVFIHARNPAQAAGIFLEDLIQRGILCLDAFNRIRFFHHTIQESFYACTLLDRDIKELIPQKGIPASRREAVVFLAGLKNNPEAYLKRALEIEDLQLAFDIFREAPQVISYETSMKLAKKIWSCVVDHSGFVGQFRHWALIFRLLASFMQIKVEELATEIDSNVNRELQIDHIWRYYANLGDVDAQRRVLANVVKNDKVPETLLFHEAKTVDATGNYELALELYTKIIENQPKYAAAYNNRAIIYKRLGQNEKALADYKKAIELDGTANRFYNFAILLYDMGQQEEAIKQVFFGLERDPTYASSHYHLADWIKEKEPETALKHYELAIHYAPHDEDLRDYLENLADLQEELGHYASVIRSLRRMIELDPMSADVRSWKERIARLRQLLDAEARTQTARERLLKQGELPFQTLAIEWLKAAGLKVTVESTSLFLTQGSIGISDRLPVVLLSEPEITGKSLRQAFHSIPRKMLNVRQTLFLSLTEALSPEARYQLAALQDECKLALVTSFKLRP